jgi:hypothetical protein
MAPRRSATAFTISSEIMPLPFQTGRAARRLVIVFGLGLALGGCSWVSGQYSDVKCPGAGVVGGIDTVSRFDGHGTGYVNLADRATLGGVKSDCSVDSSGVSVTVSMSTVAELGPQASGRTIEFPYFVAITDAHDKVVAKRVFANSVTFKPNDNRAGSQDTITERIPLSNPRDADRYHVVLGFQLTEDELAYNRTLR